jgi:GxxExxY protein
MAGIILKEESYQLIGLCMEVHTQLGRGFKEIIYKDALEYEMRLNNITYRREERFNIFYKEQLLPHAYAADFIVYDAIILEVKSTSLIVSSFVKQTVNYLKASGLQLGIIANFGEQSFVSKRVVF